MSDYNIDNAKNDIQNLQDQNSYDFQEIKRLDGLIKDYDKRVKQAINLNNQINKKIESDYNKIKKIILDENVSATLDKKIDDNYNSNKNLIDGIIVDNKNNFLEINNKINDIDTQLDTIENELATKQELEVEKNRIDSFTKLEEGSTTGDAELIDARVGTDGIIYENVGTGIRTQLSNIKEGIESLSSISNIITIDKFNNELIEGLGKYIDKYNLTLGTNVYKGACSITDNKLTNFTSEFSNNRWTILSVTAGQRLKITLRSHDTTNYHIILADKYNNVVAKYINDEDKDYKDYELIIPKNVTKLGVNSYSYIPTVLTYTAYSPLVNKDYVDNEINFLNKEIDNMSNKIGDLPNFINLIDITKNQHDGAVRGKKGELLIIETQQHYQNTWLECKQGDKFEITLLKSGVVNADDGYIHFTDDNLNVIGVDIEWDSNKTSITKEVVTPKGATRIYICSNVNASNFLAYTKCKKIINKILNNNYYKTNVGFISRQGQINNYPENSIYGIKNAYENGYDNIRVSVTMTKDHIPVLCHDETINRVARNVDGTTIANTLYVKDLTLEQINAYDWGIMYGKPELYGINITTLEEFIKFAKYRGIKIRLELKYEFSDDDINTIVLMLTKWGMLHHTTLCGSTTVLDKFYKKCKCCDYALVGNINNTAIITDILKYKNENNNVCLDMFGENYDITTPELILQYKTNGILIKVGSAYNTTDIKKWFEIGVDYIEVAYISEPHKYIYSQYS